MQILWNYFSNAPRGTSKRPTTLSTKSRRAGPSMHTTRSPTLSLSARCVVVPPPHKRCHAFDLPVGKHVKSAAAPTLVRVLTLATACQNFFTRRLRSARSGCRESRGTLTSRVRHDDAVVRGDEERRVAGLQSHDRLHGIQSKMHDLRHTH